MAQFGHSILDPKRRQAARDDEADPYAHDWLSTNVDGTAQGPFELRQLAARQPVGADGATRTTTGQKPKMDKVIFKIIPNASSRLALLKSGAVDIAYDLPLKDIKALQSDSNINDRPLPEPLRGLPRHELQGQAVRTTSRCARRSPTRCPTRRSSTQVLQGYGRQLTSPIPTGRRPTPTSTSSTRRTSTRRSSCSSEAGYPNGFDITLDVASGVDEGQETAVWVQQSLKQIGINVSIQQLPGANFASRLQKHQLGFFFFNNWISINNDPFYHLYWLFRSDCCNYTNYDNQKVWNAIDKQPAVGQRERAAPRPRTTCRRRS